MTLTGSERHLESSQNVLSKFEATGESRFNPTLDDPIPAHPNAFRLVNKMRQITMFFCVCIHPLMNTFVIGLVTSCPIV